MESTLILAYVARLASNGKSLMPQSLDAYQKAIRLIGLGLNACDKSVQIVYERDLRPVEKQHQAWRNRIQTQLTAAYDLLEPYAAQANPWLVGDRLSQADITVCVAWQFTQFTSPELIDPQRYPALAALSAKAEALPAFVATPLAPGWKPA